MRSWVHSKSASLASPLLPSAAGETELDAVDVPHRLALDLDDVGDAVLVLGRGPLGPQVVGLGQVGVRVDHSKPI